MTHEQIKQLQAENRRLRQLVKLAKGDPNITPADIIEACIAECGGSSSRLAVQSGLQYTQIRNWATGVNEPTLNSMRICCETAGLELSLIVRKVAKSKKGKYSK